MAKWLIATVVGFFVYAIADHGFGISVSISQTIVVGVAMAFIMLVFACFER